MIAWKYLDKRAATIEAMKDYKAMEFIIRDYEKAKCEGDEGIDSGVPPGGLDVLGERYKGAREYMSWYRPAWDRLAEEERYILTEFFLRDEDSRTDAINNIGDKLFIERTQVYRRRDRALGRLALLLYGR